MAQIDDLPPLRDVIRMHGLSARKAFGQNFLFDLNLTQRIAAAAGPLEDHTVLEVGPGPGGLTRALLAAGARKVVALEKDRRFAPALQEIADHYPGRLEVHEDDALQANHAALLSGPAKVVANLPYNVATPLLIGWIGASGPDRWWDSLTLLFQKEVAERIVAEPGSGAYGRLSVLAAVYVDARIAFDIAPRAFTPPPKVTSSLVHATPRDGAEIALKPSIEAVTRAAFGQRRKMLRVSLKSVFAEPERILEPLGIDPRRRAETLTVEDFVALARAHATAIR